MLQRHMILAQKNKVTKPYSTGLQTYYLYYDVYEKHHRTTQARTKKMSMQQTSYIDYIISHIVSSFLVYVSNSRIEDTKTN